MVTYLPLSFGIGVFGWVLVLLFLGWLNDQ